MWSAREPIWGWPVGTLPVQCCSDGGAEQLGVGQVDQRHHPTSLAVGARPVLGDPEGDPGLPHPAASHQRDDPRRDQALANVGHQCPAAHERRVEGDRPYAITLVAQHPTERPCSLDAPAVPGRPRKHVTEPVDRPMSGWPRPGEAGGNPSTRAKGNNVNTRGDRSTGCLPEADGGPRTASPAPVWDSPGPSCSVRHRQRPDDARDPAADRCGADRRRRPRRRRGQGRGG